VGREAGFSAAQFAETRTAPVEMTDFWGRSAGGEFFDLGYEVGGLPVVGGGPGGYFAVFADDDGGEGVGERFGVAGGDAYVEELGDGGEIFFRGGGEVPVLEGLGGVVAGVGSAVAAEDLGGVVGGVEGDAEEVGFGVEVGVGLEGFVDHGEVAGHAWAVVGQRAAGVDESGNEDFALELREVDGAVALVEEGEVGDGVSGLWDVVLDGGLVVGTALGYDDDVVEEDVAEFGAVWGGEDGGGDAIAGVELADDAGVFELVGHGHGVHEAGDGLVVEGDLCAVNGDYLATDGEGLGGRGGDCGGGGLAAALNGKDGEGKEDQGERLTGHELLLF